MGPVAKASSGWMWKLPTKAMIKSMQEGISNALSEARASSVFLRHLLRGHNLHVLFAVTAKLFGALWRFAKKTTKSCSFFLGQYRIPIEHQYFA